MEQVEREDSFYENQGNGSESYAASEAVGSEWVHEAMRKATADAREDRRNHDLARRRFQHGSDGT